MKESGSQLAGDLYTVLLAGVLERFQKSRIIISPDGILHRLPFEALRDTQGKLLITSKVISYTPSASALYVLRAHATRAPATRALLAIGG
ncbi:CHAT domain-containing protein, partial [Klebsiella pneumoniae]|uniref:CHAT domain-containing protein n=1 Tax=Klebsiella pneumoniae TaxID=573 RepID=UPI003C6D7CB5